MKIPEKAHLIGCAAGIFISWAVFGIFQEAITKGEYVSSFGKEKFTFTQALVFVQMLVNMCFSRVVLIYTGALRTDKTERKLFLPMAFTYLAAMFASNYALQYVNYPTQVIGKSIKPIPVMVLGVLIGRKRYPLLKYLFVLLIVIGVALFMYRPEKVSKTSVPSSRHSNNDLQESSSPIGFGEALLLFSLAMDGLTGGQQDRLMASSKTDPHLMMFSLNFWASVYLLIPMCATGEIFAFLSFSLRNPVVWPRLALLSIAAAIGQHFIFVTITTYGPLMCSIVTTTRKFFTVLASVLLFGHSLLAHQWFGTVLVFGGLLLDTLYGKQHAGHKSAANGCAPCSSSSPTGANAGAQQHSGVGDAVDVNVHVHAHEGSSAEATVDVDTEKRKQL